MNVNPISPPELHRGDHSRAEILIRDYSTERLNQFILSSIKQVKCSPPKSRKTIVSIGFPVSNDPERWASESKNDLSPFRLKLKPIFELFTSKFMGKLQGLEETRKRVKEALDNFNHEMLGIWQRFHRNLQRYL